MSAPCLSANPLADYLWKNPIIVLDFPSSHRADLEGVEKQIRKSKAEIKDRDLILVHVGELTGKNYAKSLNQEETRELRARLGLGKVSTSPKAILIGQDGGAKATQTKDFNLTKSYRFIDTMPMRQREMREIR